MTIDEIKEKVNGPEYEFLKNDEHLGSNIILLGLGGSYSYGMSIEGKSDVDIRGVSLNSKEEILLGQEQREQPSPEFYELFHELEKEWHMMRRTLRSRKDLIIRILTNSGWTLMSGL